MDWEIERRTHDAGILRASREHGLTFGPSTLKRLDDLDSNIAIATAEVACLRQKLRQPTQAIAAELNFERRQVLKSAVAVEGPDSLDQKDDSVVEWQAPVDCAWQWWTLPAPPSPPRSDSPPQRLRYPGSRSTAAGGAECAPAEAAAVIANARGGLERVPAQAAAATASEGSCAPGALDRALAGRLRRRHLEQHRWRRGRQLEADFHPGLVHPEPRPSRQQSSENQGTLECTQLPLDRTLLPRQRPAGAERLEVLPPPPGECNDLSAPPLPHFLKGHPSRLAAAMRVGFKTSIMKQAGISAAGGERSALVLPGDAAGPEVVGLWLGRAPTELEWVAHNWQPDA